MKQLTLTELLEVRGGSQPDYSRYDCDDLRKLVIEWIDREDEKEECRRRANELGCGDVGC